MNIVMKRNKIINSLILIILTGIGIISCTGISTHEKRHTGVEYYRNLQYSVTPYDIEKGIHPLTVKESKTINSYKFTYDNLGRLLTVEYVRNNLLLGYSSMGSAAKVVYEYSGNKQIKHYFDMNNEPVESAGAFMAEYTLDSNGNRIALKYFGRYGEPIENRFKIHSWTWTKMPDGMIKELRYTLSNVETVINPFCPFYELRFSYNNKGFVTRMANYRSDTLYNCTAENCGDIGVSYFTFRYNEYGDFETFSVFNANGQMSNLYWGWSKRINKFDENGYIIETAFFDQDNEYMVGKRVPVVQNVYDSHGAIIEIRNMDKDRNITGNPENKVAITKYRYDDLGKRIETLRFDKDNNPLYMKYDLTTCCCF
jgi:hypothetical protein